MPPTIQSNMILINRCIVYVPELKIGHFQMTQRNSFCLDKFTVHLSH